MVLKRLGLPVLRRKTVGGPDIQIQGRPTLWIEAVTPSPTDGLLSSYEESKRDATEDPEDAILLRYTGVLQTKWEKYNEYRSKGIVAPSDGYVIAISGSGLPRPSRSGKNGQPPSVAQALYGIGPYGYCIERDTIKAGWLNRSVVAKPQNGSPVASDLFLGDKMPGVSAVLYSAHHIRNRPEVWGDDDGWDFLLFHNPFATVPLDLGLIKRGQEWGLKDGEPKKLVDYRNSSL